MSFALVVSALTEQLPPVLSTAAKLGLSSSDAWNVLVVLQLREALRRLARAQGRDVSDLATGRLFENVPGFEMDALAAERLELATALSGRVALHEGAGAELPIEAFGQLYESLLAARPTAGKANLRKQTGSYYTPESLTRIVLDRAFQALPPSLIDSPAGRPLRILDPALGAGAFLVQAARELSHRSGRSLKEVVQRELFGVDVSPLAVAVAEASLWLLASSPELSLKQAGAGLREGDALCSPVVASTLGRYGVDFVELAGGMAGFDLVLGNPPWVAFAGRATQPLAPALRLHYRRNFRAFRGYPTLHALFVELAARLAPQGVVALLIPSPMADLDGYRHARAALSQTHTVCEPLLELGQDAFSSVTQSCFVLVASPGRAVQTNDARPFVLTERKHADATASVLSSPSALLRLGSLPRLPPELFGEMGLQTNGFVTRQLLYRGDLPPPDFDYPLLEGRSVREFAASSAKLFLKPDRALLTKYRCRLRDAADYSRVRIVVRQTAAIIIAAAHDGTPFRNSLLAGFELPEFPFALTLGLLNSTLYRALHLAARRDARQGAFPQVKVGHLRSLPAPGPSSARLRVAALALEAGHRGLTLELRRALDDAVFGLFDISTAERSEILRFVCELSPRAGLSVPLSADGVD